MPPNLDALLAPVSSTDPCGLNLEYGDAAFAELDRSTRGKAEQQIGATIIPAEEPDWKTVELKATELLGRTKDLRVAVHLTKALLHRKGLQGFADGLMILSGLVETYWEGLHPRLDPDDGNDPTMRLNILATLTAPEVLMAIRMTPLVTSRTIGRFSLKDLEAAATEASTNGNGQAKTATIEAAGMDCDLATLEANTSAALACVTALRRLESALATHIEAGSAPSFGSLSELVKKMANFLEALLHRRVPSAGPVSIEIDPASAVGVPSTNSVLPGEIGSREDVLRVLDKISEYYKKNEPSSPIPLFMARCKRLVMMSFVDIVRELAPEALSQVEALKGRSE
jgi:type VI secretion system protein ImpA